MKAMVYTKYGPPDVLQLQEVKRPTARDNEVLVQIQAASINYSDWAFLRGKPFLVRLMGSGLRKPANQILGSDLAGRVEAVGSKVTNFLPGDEVFGEISGDGRGAFAEFAAVSEDDLLLKPAQLPFELAAAVPQAAVVALQGLRDKGDIQPGQKVLINGASGGIGSFAVQIAKSFGAEVTGVCSTRNLEMVRSLGADQVIDYTQEDFCQNGQGYDLILGAGGYRSIYDYKRALAPQGTYVMSGGAMKQVFQAILLGPLLSEKGGKTLGNLAAMSSQKDLQFISELLETGKVTPLIDRRYPLNETAEALRYYGAGHSRGKVVITVTN